MSDTIMNGDVIEGDEGFETCDLYLAAFFVSAGCKMLSAYRDQKTKRVFFVFEKSPILMDLRLNYFSRDAKVPALTFADNIKSLKSLCHNIITSTKP
jgi:hypothetical protein